MKPNEITSSVIDRITDDVFTSSDTPSEQLAKRAIRLRKQIQRCGLRQGDVAERIGISRQTINKLLRGRQKLTYAWAKHLAPALETTPEFLLGETNIVPNAPSPQQSSAELPVITKKCVAIPTLACPAGAGGGRILEMEPSTWGRPSYFDEELILDKIRASPRHLCSITIEGQSMEPVLQNGDTVLVNLQKNHVTEPGIFVLFDGDGIVCKWVERVLGSEPAQYLIKSENPRFSSYKVLAEQTQILGRVVWYGRVL